MKLFYVHSQAWKHIFRSFIFKVRELIIVANFADALKHYFYHSRQYPRWKKECTDQAALLRYWFLLMNNVVFINHKHILLSRALQRLTSGEWSAFLRFEVASTLPVSPCRSKPFGWGECCRNAMLPVSLLKSASIVLTTLVVKHFVVCHLKFNAHQVIFWGAFCNPNTQPRAH